MKVLLINSVCGIGSTGRICTDIAQKLTSDGHEVKIAYGREEVPEQHKKYAVKIGGALDTRLHGISTRLLDRHGFGSYRATKRFLQWAEGYDPDLLWLHNLHGYYIHIELLFDWIKSRPNMQVKWTLHDCWAFTGHCTYFTVAKCDKWKTGCKGCPQKREYPASLFRDNSENNYNRKKAAFTGVKNMTLITPSQWLAGLADESFLKEYPTEVRHNTIDTTVFRPTPGKFRERYGLENKRIVLGVASVWNERKGLRDFLELAKRLDSRYMIVLVGLSEKQIKALPGNILGLPRTNSIKELAEIYTAADVFVNPTYEDNYPTVNLEAEACGTKVVTYRTGGAPETISRKDSVVVTTGQTDALKAAIESFSL